MTKKKKPDTSWPSHLGGTRAAWRAMKRRELALLGEVERLRAALVAAVYVGGDHVERAVDEVLEGPRP